MVRLWKREGTIITVLEFLFIHGCIRAFAWFYTHGVVCIAKYFICSLIPVTLPSPPYCRGASKFGNRNDVQGPLAHMAVLDSSTYTSLSFPRFTWIAFSIEGVIGGRVRVQGGLYPLRPAYVYYGRHADLQRRP
ncbi:hypothetical protein M011DRAFT_137564 [Sporormia fimetaria CBS 119925]|uniref:Uncharacterized protein n=1 Tax=Sporormia fimetaria CBS 119925 TaxID=1340428 RepID=A0A6A6V6Y8_9PLEO|nr:hypothetical protein M011DRAFT_137564 [Sporormia fimetaria CBS 119925]